jgi:cysteine-rich repeat protein
MWFTKPLGLLALLLVAAALLADASRTYGVTSLSSANCTIVNNLDATIGDDRSGMAITPTRIFHLGDNFMVSADALTLGDQVLLAIMDGIISDLGDGALWTLAFNESMPLDGDNAGSGNFNITHIIPLRSTNNASVDPSRSVVALSEPLNPYWDSRQPLVFAGVRGFAFVSSMPGPSPFAGLFYVSLSTGEVTRLYPEGTDLAPDGWYWDILPGNGSIEESENWAAWGVMEETQGEVTLLAAGYYSSNPGIHRWAINGTYLGTVFSGDLSDCAAFTVNYFEMADADKRWYAHGEGSGLWAETTNEWLVACPGTHFSLCGNDHLNAGEECDDGNLTNGDGCDDACNLESDSSASSLTCPLCALLA